MRAGFQSASRNLGVVLRNLQMVEWDGEVEEHTGRLSQGGMSKVSTSGIRRARRIPKPKVGLEDDKAWSGNFAIRVWGKRYHQGSGWAADREALRYEDADGHRRRPFCGRAQSGSLACAAVKAIGTVGVHDCEQGERKERWEEGTRGSSKAEGKRFCRWVVRKSYPCLRAVAIIPAWCYENERIHAAPYVIGASHSAKRRWRSFAPAPPAPALGDGEQRQGAVSSGGYNKQHRRHSLMIPLAAAHTPGRAPQWASARRQARFPVAAFARALGKRSTPRCRVGEQLRRRRGRLCSAGACSTMTTTSRTSGMRRSMRGPRSSLSSPGVSYEQSELRLGDPRLPTREALGAAGALQDCRHATSSTGTEENAARCRRSAVHRKSNGYPRTAASWSRLAGGRLSNPEAGYA
ncbi:hypothetical protein FB451DRAFT_1193009 [Mycena latifolia]|nr:hypothetical protein FB451DRAFT_1193009 [Mycena latifolia]